MAAVFAFQRLRGRAILAGIACALACTLGAAKGHSEGAATILQLDAADFEPRPCAQSGHHELVRLPDLWSRRASPSIGAGCYRIRFEMQGDVPRDILSLRIDRISTTHSIWLNGQLVSQQTSFRYPAHVDTRPRLFEVPQGALRIGTNELSIDLVIDVPVRAGLSSVTVGPQELLRPEFESVIFWSAKLPQSLNLAIAGLAVMLLLVWLERRRDKVFLHFGALMLVSSLRSYAYYLDTPIGSVQVNDCFFYVSNLWSMAFLAAFAVSFASDGGALSESKHQMAAGLLSRVGYLVATLLSVVAIFASLGGWFRTLKAVSYPFAMSLALGAMALIVLEAKRRGRASFVLFLLSMTLLGLAVIHDYLLMYDTFGISVIYWLPFTLPVLLSVYALVLVKKLVAAMAGFEALTGTLEARVIERTNELREANAAKTRFLAAASHDLRQPLHAVSLLTGLLQERIRYPGVRSLVDKIQFAVDGMGDLLKGLLDLSRLDANAVSTTLEDVAVAHLFGAVRAVEAPVAEVKNLTIRFARCSAVVRTDRALAESILRNLVANATRYTDQGGILVGARRKGRHVLIQVHDTGVGIASSELALIFREFYQVRGVGRDRTAGLGLGLSIVKRTAELLGHPLRCRSQPGKGSTFEFEMPVARFERSAHPSADPASGPASMNGQFVVVIEDDDAVRDALEGLLLAWGCHVAVGGTLGEIEAVLPSHLRDPDLLICDYQLAHSVDGLACIRALRERIGEPIPALLVTGGLTSLEFAGVESTNLAVLPKPVRPGDLRDACVRLLGMEVRVATV